MGPFCQVTPDIEDLVHMYDHRQGRNPVLIELTRLTTSDELPELLDRAIDTLRLVRANVYDAYDVAALLSELAGNVLEHGGGSGYLAMQVYGSGQARFLELAIGDGGPGIRQSLHTNPSLPRMTDDLQAIIAAIRTGVSSSQEPTRGTGLHQMLRIVIGHGGSAQIRTGSAKVRWRAGRPTGSGFVVPHLGGTQVSFSIPAT
jgi:anti-sigma regulatory factor (Ser/Thr protein kinase)